MLKWQAEFDPDDTKDYTVNWTEEMAKRNDDTLITALFETDTPINGLTISTSSVDETGKKAIMWVTAADKPKLIALAGTAVPISHVITTSGGRTLTRTIGLKIKER